MRWCGEAIRNWNEKYYSDTSDIVWMFIAYSIRATHLRWQIENSINERMRNSASCRQGGRERRRTAKKQFQVEFLSNSILYKSKVFTMGQANFSDIFCDLRLSSFHFISMIHEFLANFSYFMSVHERRRRVTEKMKNGKFDVFIKFHFKEQICSLVVLHHSE